MRRSLVGLLLICLIFTPSLAVRAQTIAEINQEIQAKQKKIDELKKQIETYQKAIASKQADAASLKRQLEVLEDRIAQAELDIEANELKLNTTTLQIQSVTLEIAARERDLNNKKSEVGAVLREINRYDQRTLLEIAVVNSSLGEFFEQLNYLESLQGTLQNAINQVEIVKTELEHKQQDLANYRAQLSRTQTELTLSREKLSTEQTSKENLLTQTKQSESKFQSLLTQAVQEQERANRDIQSLEQEVRRRLNQQGAQGRNQLGDATFIWPVSPTKGISTYFYDPTYIFRRYFEHPAIDIPKPQGSPIKAASSGYVARAKDGGLGYSYIMLVHANGFATVYGHVSRIDVAEDTYVTQGQVIGAVGGLPGTRGAGRLTTGPHLHFEVRSNGIPVNPLDYLP